MKNYIISILIISVLILAPVRQVLAESGEEVLEKSQQEVSGVWEKIKDFSEKVANAVFGFLKNAWQGIGDTWEKHIQPWTQDFWNNFKIEFEKEMDETGEELSELGKNVWNKILDWLKLKKD